MVWYLWCSRRRDCDRKAAGGGVAGGIARRTGHGGGAEWEGAATGRGTGHRNRPRYRVTGCRRVGDHRPTGAGRLAREIARQIQRRWRGIHNGDGKVTVCRVAGGIARRTGHGGGAEWEGAATGQGTRHRNRSRHRVTGCRRVGDHRPTGAGRLAREIARQIQRRWGRIDNGDGKAAGRRISGGIARRTGHGGGAKREGAATGRGTRHRNRPRYRVTGRCRVGGN